jgi:hypothetical protein
MITILDSMPAELLDIPAKEVYIRNKSKSERQYIRILENSIQMYSTIERGDVLEYGRAIIVRKG